MSETVPEGPSPIERTLPVPTIGESESLAQTAVINAPEEGLDRELKRAPRGPWPLGAVSVVLAAIMLILEAVAIALANSEKPGPATTLALILNWATILPVLLGVLAMIFGKQRKLGLAGALMALVANPFLLTQLMNLFSGH